MYVYIAVEHIHNIYISIYIYREREMYIVYVCQKAGGARCLDILGVLVGAHRLGVLQLALEGVDILVCMCIYIYIYIYIVCYILYNYMYYVYIYIYVYTYYIYVYMYICRERERERDVCPCTRFGSRDYRSRDSFGGRFAMQPLFL